MKNMRILLGILFIAVFAVGCSEDSDSPSTSNPTAGHLVVRLTDAPAAYDEINITFTNLEINHEDAWYSILLDSAMTVDILQWNNGQSIVMGEGDLPPGSVKEVRLIIDRASIVVDGTEYPMDVPSGTSSGLKIKVRPELVIEAGVTYVLVLDFDAQQSVKTTGPPNNPNGYKLQPVIRAVPEAVSGSISGTVTNPDAYAVAVAVDSNGTDIGSSVADSLTGAFTIGFLPAGTYTVEIEDTLGRKSSTAGVLVETGKNTDIGSVTLQ